jgi:hypothetical protein
MTHSHYFPNNILMSKTQHAKIFLYIIYTRTLTSLHNITTRYKESPWSISLRETLRFLLQFTAEPRVRGTVTWKRLRQRLHVHVHSLHRGDGTLPSVYSTMGTLAMGHMYRHCSTCHLLSVTVAFTFITQAVTRREAGLRQTSVGSWRCSGVRPTLRAVSGSAL